MGKTYVGNTSGKSVLPKKIYVGNGSNQAKLCKVAYVGNSSGKSVEVWRDSTLPSAYQKVEYIYNTGRTQYIDTGIKPNSDTTTEIDILWPIANEQVYSRIFGAYGSYYYSIHSYFSAGIVFEFGDFDVTGTPEYDISPNVRYKLRFNVPGGKFYVNDTLVKTSYETFSALNSNMLLFASKDIRYSRTYMGPSIYVYHFVVKQNNVYVRDMYPCYRKSDNVIGMYDLVNGKFYTNAGTGIFYKGPNV